MKKISIILSAILVLLLCSCGKAPVSNIITENAPSNSEPTQKIELNIPLGEYFTIVEATYTTKLIVGEKVSVYLKIKNNTDQDFRLVTFQYYSYDKNGDKVGQVMGDIDALEANHSAWTTAISTFTTLNEFGSIRIEYFEIQEFIDDNTVTTLEIVDLNPNPEILLSQMTEKD